MVNIAQLLEVRATLSIIVCQTAQVALLTRMANNSLMCREHLVGKSTDEVQITSFVSGDKHLQLYQCLAVENCYNLLLETVFKQWVSLVKTVL